MSNEEKMYNPNELEIGILAYLKKRKIYRWPDIVYTNYKPLRGMLLEQVNEGYSDILGNSGTYPSIPNEDTNEKMLVVMDNVSIEPLLTYFDITSSISYENLLKFSEEVLFNIMWWHHNTKLFGLHSLLGMYFSKKDTLLPIELGEIMNKAIEMGTEQTPRELKLIRK